MVHLAQIKSDSQVASAANKRASLVPGLEHISLEAPGPDEFSTSVYGSQYAAEDLPSHELPDKEMPREIAYRMIRDELSLDGNPMLKFVHPRIFYRVMLTRTQFGQLRHHIHGMLFATFLKCRVSS